MLCVTLFGPKSNWFEIFMNLQMTGALDICWPCNCFNHSLFDLLLYANGN